MLVHTHADLHVEALVEGGFGGGDYVWMAVAKVGDAYAASEIQYLCTRACVHVTALGVRDDVWDGQSDAAAEVLLHEGGIKGGGCRGRTGGGRMRVVGKGGKSSGY